MAEVSSENITDGDIEEICQSMRAFVKLSGKKDNLDIMNSKACGKIVKDALPKEVVTIADASKTSKTGNVCGLTDTKQYTGTHKERFDEEGKGKGKEGRVDIPDDSGYVQAYKEKGTYNETH
ncbi:hypothetical protein KUTeg_004432 [Tegillarca granosa]|uniref:Uncharacterized protein n=1 Tax=Tegillarca granosa TaxID=220873 RepID=A0ABQ9FPY1_TEGGR|nr:hypothetical protein KUTeg_004432 [Tegillarca granosa]